MLLESRAELAKKRGSPRGRDRRGAGVVAGRVCLVTAHQNRAGAGAPSVSGAGTLMGFHSQEAQPSLKLEVPVCGPRTGCTGRVTKQGKCGRPAPPVTQDASGAHDVARCRQQKHVLLRDPGLQHGHGRPRKLPRAGLSTPTGREESPAAPLRVRPGLRLTWAGP